MKYHRPFPTKSLLGTSIMKQAKRLLCLALLLLFGHAASAQEWVVYQGKEGPGKGKHVVLISGDEEYRSEEVLPQLGKILAERHGFKCTVLFAIDPKDGTIHPNVQTNIPGLESLQSADLVVMFLRFRNLPPAQMRHIEEYVKKGKPIIGLRTSTHAFNIPGPKGKNAEEPEFRRYSFNSRVKGWDGGFGRQVFGETWISHHGKHGSQSTRGIVAPGQEQHPILRGIKDGDIWGPTDVYGVRLPLPGDSRPLVLGQVLKGMKPTDAPVEGKQNDPMMPIAWTKTYQVAEDAPKGRAFCCTSVAGQDFESEGLRRLLVNACYWALAMEERIPPRSEVGFVGEYRGTPFGFNRFKKGVRPKDHQ